MAFMQPDIYYGSYYEIDTTEGIALIPLSASGMVDSLEDLRDYYSGEVMDEDSVSLEVQEGWLYRLSAPGYMDCTEWSVADTKQEAKDSLNEMYGDDEDEDKSAW